MHRRLLPQQKKKKISHLVALLIVASLCIFSFALYYSTHNDGRYYPRPYGYIHIEHPPHSYVSHRLSCGAFDIPALSHATSPSEDLLCLYYPSMKAHINIRYGRENIYDTGRITSNIEKNIARLSSRAYRCYSSDYESACGNIKASIYSMEGDVATPLAFCITDTFSHDYIYGVAYFDLHPNYDSLLPSINHIKRDIIQMIESYTPIR